MLDRRLDGGIPVGTVVALTAPPTSQSELLLGQLATVRPVVYVSTVCPDGREVRERLPASAGDDQFTHVYATPADLEDAPDWTLGAVVPESFVVIDPLNAVETAARDAHLSFLNAFKRRVRETDSVGVLHCLEEDATPEGRHRTLKRADHVWQLELAAESREIKNRLLVTKSRGGRALTEPIPLLLTGRVRVDTSRRIA